MTNFLPIYHTYVLYELSCISCKILAYFSLFPAFLVAHLVFSFIQLQDLSILFILMGHLANEVVNSILKKALKIPRPFHPGHDENEHIGYGMPSSHAGFMAFYSVVWGNWKSVPLTLIVIYSRYHLSYHHLDQLIAGAIVGTIMGILWKQVIYWLNLFEYPYLLNSKNRIFDLGQTWRNEIKRKKNQ
eukprot:NODE_636_length_5161_cov_0.504544.p4 type:complete len:187 gc:universal NODE_636_length_5161_cov_0.504544:1903-1343(-)